MPRLDIKPPFIGLNTRDDSSTLEQTEAVEALNVSLEKGTIKQREGYTQKAALSAVISNIFNWPDSPTGAAALIVGAGIHTQIGTASAVAVADGTPGTEASHTVPTTVPQMAVFNGRADIVYETATGGRLYARGSDLVSGASAARYHGRIPKPVATMTYEPSDTGGNNNRTRIDGGANFSERLDGIAGGGADTATSDLRGQYSWKLTYYSQAWDVEGVAAEAITDASTEGWVVGADDDVAKISVPEANQDLARADGRVTHINLYRRRLSSSQFEWHFVKRVPLITASGGAQLIFDNHHNAEVSLTQIAPLSAANDHCFEDSTPDIADDGSGEIPLRTIAVHNRVMYAGSTDSRLFFSRTDKPGVLNEYIVVGDGSPITGVESFNGMLYVFTETDIYTLDGHSKSTFKLSKKVKGTGCHAIGSIVPTDNGIYFLGDDAIYAFDGENVQKMSEPIKDKINDRHKLNDNKVVGGWDKDKGCVFWTLYSGASASSVIVLEYRHSRAAKRPSWVEWKFKNSGGTALHLAGACGVTDATNRMDMVYAFSAGKVGKKEGYLDDTTRPIIVTWKTGKINGGAPGVIKKWGTIDINQVEQGSGGDTLNVTATSDTAVALTGLSVEVPILYNRIRTSGRELELRFYRDSNLSSLEILGIGIEVNTAGRG